MLHLSRRFMKHAWRRMKPALPPSPRLRRTRRAMKRTFGACSESFIRLHLLCRLHRDKQASCFFAKFLVKKMGCKFLFLHLDIIRESSFFYANKISSKTFPQPPFPLKICAVDFINTLCRIYCGIMAYLHNFKIICIKYT